MGKEDFEDKPEVLDKPTPDEKAFEGDKFLWEVIKRIDFYIGTTNTKAALLIPFNTFILATIVLQYSQWPVFLGPNHNTLQTAGQGLLVLTGLACIFSLVPTFLTISPFMSGATERSVLFYRNIAALTGPAYAEKMQALDRKTAIADMANQAHTLSKGVLHKFWLLRVATVAVLVELAGLAILLIFKIIAILQAAAS